MPTLAHPSLNTLRYHGLAPAVTADRKPERKLRCRMLDEKLNWCSNEALTDFGLCAHCLAEAHHEYESLIESAAAAIRERRGGHDS